MLTSKSSCERDGYTVQMLYLVLIGKPPTRWREPRRSRVHSECVARCYQRALRVSDHDGGELFRVEGHELIQNSVPMGASSGTCGQARLSLKCELSCKVIISYDKHSSARQQVQSSSFTITLRCALTCTFRSCAQLLPNIMSKQGLFQGATKI